MNSVRRWRKLSVLQAATLIEARPMTEIRRARRLFGDGFLSLGEDLVKDLDLDYRIDGIESRRLVVSAAYPE
jgi:hypothetical protein